MSRLVVLSLLLGVLCAYPAEAGGTKLKGNEVVALIAGKTIYWVNGNGYEGRWYYDKKGNWRGQCCSPFWNLEIGGTWKISKDRVCQYWGKGRPNQIGQKYCWYYVKDSGDYYMRSKRAIKLDNQGTHIRKIANGNPDNL